MGNETTGSAGTVAVSPHGLERFPFTKFLPPAVDGRASVGRVVARLGSAVASHPVTVLTAPGGSGKTTALAAWAAAAEDGAVLWVRLGPDDNVPAVAAGALLEAGRRHLDPAFGRRLGQIVSQTGAVDVPSTVTSLVNDLGDAPAAILVLDDFHAVTAPETVAMFEQLLDHLPPHVRVVIASRTEPALSLARRRVRGELAELGLQELLLDREAVREVLAQDGETDDGYVDAVVAASGGWAAAVRLATTHAGEGHVRLPAAGSAPVTSMRADLHRFLAEEVLDALPERLGSFLLETAVLDELAPDLCDAVTGRSDSGQLLLELDRRNLFLTRHRGGDAETWRTHDLFADFLREQLSARWPGDAVRSLHRRASAVLPPLRAIPHLLAADEYDRAAQLMIDLAFADLDSSTAMLLRPLIDALPAEVVDRYHRLALLRVWAGHLSGDGRGVRAALEPLRDRLRASGELLAVAEIDAMLVEAYLELGDLERADEAFAELLAQPVEPWLRVSGLASRMWARYFRGDWAGVSESLQGAVEVALADDRASSYNGIVPALSAELLFADQGASWVLDHAERCALGTTPGDALCLAALRMVRAGVALLRLDVATAEAEARQCLRESAEYGRLAWKHQEAEAHLMAVCLGTGDLARVRAVVEEAIPLFASSPIHDLQRAVYVHAALRCQWLEGDHRQLAETYHDLLGARPRTGRALETVACAIAASMVARAEGRGLEALEALQKAEEVQRRERCWWWVGLPGLERGSILLEEGRVAGAIEAAVPTLDAAAELGPGILFAEARVHRPLLERCARAGIHPALVRAVLTATETESVARGPAVIPGSGERLSVREIEVLEQVATGASNRGIAEALFISEVTVKSHLTRILRKLEASSRTHAVARARQLRLL